MKKCLITSCIILLLLLTPSAANALSLYVSADGNRYASQEFSIPYLSKSTWTIKAMVQNVMICEILDLTSDKWVFRETGKIRTTGVITLQPGKYRMYASIGGGGGSGSFDVSHYYNDDKITLSNDNILTNSYTVSPVRISWNKSSNRKYKIFNNGTDITAWLRIAPTDIFMTRPLLFH